MPTYDPGLPAWADALVIVMVALTPVWLLLANRGLRREIRKTGDTAERAESHARAAADSAAVAEHEVRPNSGSSLADATNRTERAVEGLTQSVEALRRQTGRLEQAQADTARDVGGMRSEVRTERDERRDVSARLDRHLDDDTLPTSVVNALTNALAEHVKTHHPAPTWAPPERSPDGHP